MISVAMGDMLDAIEMVDFVEIANMVDIANIANIVIIEDMMDFGHWTEASSSYKWKLQLQQSKESKCSLISQEGIT